MFWQYVKNSLSPLSGTVIITALVFAGIMGYHWRGWAQDRAIRTGGIPTMATVADLAVTGTGTKTYSAGVSYRPLDSASNEYARHNVDGSLYRGLHTGTAVPIRYSRSNTKQIWIEGDDPRTLWLLIFSLPLVVGPAEFLRVLWQSGRRARRLSTGTTTLGQIVALVEPPAGNQNQVRRDLRYAFTDSDGTRREGVYSGLPDRIGIFAKPGDPIRISYDRQHPDRHEAEIYTLDALRTGALDRSVPGKRDSATTED